MHLSLRENASKAKNHATAVLGETLGTAMFLFIVCLTPPPMLAQKDDRLTFAIIGRGCCEDGQSR
jgi:hypothetical protein